MLFSFKTILLLWIYTTTIVRDHSNNTEYRVLRQTRHHTMRAVNKLGNKILKTFTKIFIKKLWGQAPARDLGRLWVINRKAQWLEKLIGNKVNNRSRTQIEETTLLSKKCQMKRNLVKLCVKYRSKHKLITSSLLNKTTLLIIKMKVEQQLWIIQVCISKLRKMVEK